MYVDTKANVENWRDYYGLLIGSVTPRPIALVSSLSKGGTQNLAPFSWFNMVSGNPPVLMVCTGIRRDGRPKDTLDNIRATKEFNVAIVTESIANQMVRCATELPADQSEFDWSGLTPKPATQTKPPLVLESPVNLECKLRQVITINDEPGGGNIILGDIVGLHVEDWLLAEDGLIDSAKLRTVGRLGRSEYVNVVDRYSMQVPPPEAT